MTELDTVDTRSGTGGEDWFQRHAEGVAAQSRSEEECSRLTPEHSKCAVELPGLHRYGGGATHR